MRLRGPSNGKKRLEKAEAGALSAALPPLMLRAEQLAKNFNPGTHGRRKAGVGEDFWQFRHYNEQDSTSEIDWRQSAKRDQLYIRQNELETAESVWFWMDSSPNMAFRSDLADHSKQSEGRVLTLATAMLLMKGGENFGLIGGVPRTSHGTVAFERFAETLINQSGLNLDALIQKSSISRKSRLVLVSDFLYPPSEIKKCLRMFSRLGCPGVLLHMADPAEVEFPYSGRTLFEGLSERISLTLGRAESVKEQYQTLFTAHKKSVQNLAQSLSWDYIFHSTEDPVSPALASLYQALEGGRG